MTEQALAKTDPKAATCCPTEAMATREPERAITPPVDIFETESGLTVLADLPGVTQENLEVKVDQGVLTIAGRVAPSGEASDPIYAEFGLRNYFRQFKLGEQVDTAKIAAELKQGVLRVTLPKPETAQPKRIDVKVN